MTTSSTLTVQDLLNKLADMPKDAIICTYHQGNLYDIVTIRRQPLDDSATKGELNIIVNDN